jgi:hypothetical protein
MIKLSGVLVVALAVLVAGGAVAAGNGSAATPQVAPQPVNSDVVVLSYNDLGMHCINPDFSEFMILPPYNTLRAQVIGHLGPRPWILTSGLTVSYWLPGNTHSADKLNFWSFVDPLLGLQLASDVGLTGNRLAGTMIPTSNGDWAATGIPLTPMSDRGRENPYQLAIVSVSNAKGEVARTQPVVPVSWELRCDLCHNGSDAPLSVLDAHDDPNLGHGTTLAAQKPVLCGGCHAQPELGLAGTPGVSNLSHAIHRAHSVRMGDVVDMLNGNACYACHPGPATQCLRDVHATAGMACVDCHAQDVQDKTDLEAVMLAVADPSRSPWATEPRCGSAGCHEVAGHDYEQAGALYRNSRGHGNVTCPACHGSPHAIAPSGESADNVQAVMLQGHPGTIECSVCHGNETLQAFRHRLPLPK